MMPANTSEMASTPTRRAFPNMGTEYLEVAEKGMAAYRAPSLLQPHKARQAFRDAYAGKIKPLIGYYSACTSVLMGRVLAQMGADAVWIDWEHSACNVETMTSMVHDIQFQSEGRTMAFVRVPGHDHGAIGFALDTGASIVVPQVDTVEQAQHVVSAAKFGASRKGTRSAPPMRWLPGTSDGRIDPSRSLWENLNDQAAIIFQIESVEGVRNLDAILTAVGSQIDALWLGVLDLRANLGLDSFWGEEPEFLELVALYRDTLKKHDMPDSGMCLWSNWDMGSNKAFVVVGGDVFGVMSDMKMIGDARVNLQPLAKGTNGTATAEVPVEKVVTVGSSTAPTTTATTNGHN